MPQEGKMSVSPEEEIRELEQKLEEKKRALAAEGGAAAPEKEVFREVMREHIGAVQPPAAGAPPVLHIPSRVPARTKGATETEETEEQEEKLRVLIERALTRNIADAVAAASESPYLLDALHDRLVDEYYDKLVALRKIDAL